MKFKIEQIAISPADPAQAFNLLSLIGANEWHKDNVTAAGEVFGEFGMNEAELNFNYELSGTEGKPIEFEVLQYKAGPNWIAGKQPLVTHLGMHCTEEELDAWREKFSALGIGVAQEVKTREHTNPVIAGQRWYRYVIFDTREILGVDLKFIVRRDSLEG